MRKKNSNIKHIFRKVAEAKKRWHNREKKQVKKRLIAKHRTEIEKRKRWIDY